MVGAAKAKATPKKEPVQKKPKKEQPAGNDTQRAESPKPPRVPTPKSAAKAPQQSQPNAQQTQQEEAQTGSASSTQVPNVISEAPNNYQVPSTYFDEQDEHMLQQGDAQHTTDAKEGRSGRSRSPGGTPKQRLPTEGKAKGKGKGRQQSAPPRIGQTDVEPQQG